MSSNTRPVHNKMHKHSQQKETNSKHGVKGMEFGLELEMQN